MIQDEFCYFVIKFCPGGDLSTYLKNNGPLSEHDAKYYIKSVVKSLKILHSKGIIHRDLKVNFHFFFGVPNIKL